MARQYSLPSQGKKTRWDTIELDPLEGILVLIFLFLRFNFDFACLPPRTNITLSLGFADKVHTTPQLSLVNIQALNFLLRSKIYVSADGQLWAAPLILDYEPLTRALVEAGQAIRAGSPRLA